MFDLLKIMVKIREDLRFFFVVENGEDDDQTKMLFKRKFHLKEKDNITNKIYIRHSTTFRCPFPLSRKYCMPRYIL